MKKIMFNDRYGLTEAVLTGRKTQTRRVAYDFRKHASNKVGKCVLLANNNLTYKDGDVQVLDELRSPQYRVGEVVAVAQSYKDCGYGECAPIVSLDENGIATFGSDAGSYNKMFVKADLMPHHIRITNVRVERLQDISDEDCIKEGVCKWTKDKELYKYDLADGFEMFEWRDKPRTPREAYAALIDKISSKGTWESNPYVFVYDFELVK